VARSTEAEVERRQDIVSPLVLDCLSFREIRTYLAAKTAWGAQISDSQLRRYIATANRQIAGAATYERNAEIGAAKGRLQRVIARASAKGDLRALLAANKQLTDLMGLAEPSRSEVEVSLEDIDRAIARQKDKIAANEARKRG
jgi:hypothetical protein